MLVRILAAAIGLPLLLAVVFLLPTVATAIVFAAACMVGAYEMLWRTGILRHRRLVAETAVMAAAVVMWSWLRAEQVFSGDSLWLLAMGGFFLFACVLCCELLAGHTELKFGPVCVCLFAGLVYPFLVGALVRLRGMEGGKFYILVAFVISMVADSGAYFVGKACGKHKLAPVISPKKTVEGAIGGVVFNILGMMLYTILLNRCFGFAQVNYFYAAIYGVVGAFGSMLGDLTLSVVKRQVGIKDYGNLIPGHGGILDRFDSTMICAPVAELLILLIPFAVK